MTRAAGIRTKGYVMIAHPTDGLDSLEETAEFLKDVELDLCPITKFTPYPGTPAYPTIRSYGSFDEDWEQTNAMNFQFIPAGLSEEVLETYFDHLYRTFYSRPDILWGLAKLLVREPTFMKRLAASSAVYLRRQFAAGHCFVGRLPRRYRVALTPRTEQ